MAFAGAGGSLLRWGLPKAESEKQAAPCATPEHRQLDFWMGSWDVYETADRSKQIARARVDGLLSGCVLHEVYEGNNGLKGQSFSLYDSARKLWHQSWVTNRGQLLLLDGGMEGDRMVLSGTLRTTDGTTELIRGEWTRVEGGVREVATTSKDGGKSWLPLFDLMFRAHAAKGP
jgi:hypothetical protein